MNRLAVATYQADAGQRSWRWKARRDSLQDLTVAEFMHVTAVAIVCMLHTALSVCPQVCYTALQAAHLLGA